MKKKNIFIGSLILGASVMMLVGCGKKNTKEDKKDNVSETTSGGSGDTSDSTSKTSNGGSSSEYAQYQIDKDSFNTLFNYTNAEEINLTINKTSTLSNGQSYIKVIELDKGKMLESVPGNADETNYYSIIQEANVELTKWNYWGYQMHYYTDSYTNSDFLNKYALLDLDYDKLTFDEDNLSYVYSEEAGYEFWDESYQMVYRYYNIELKFEDSNLLNVSYDVDYNVYEDGVEKSEYGYDYKEVLTVSKVGTTTVNNPYEKTVTVTTTDGGTIDGDGDYALGDEVTLVASPEEGKEFVGWFKAGSTTPVSEEPTYKFELEDDVTLEARFKNKENYILTITRHNDKSITYRIPMSNPTFKLPSVSDLASKYDLEGYDRFQYFIYYDEEDDDYYDYSFEEEIELDSDLELELFIDDIWYVMYCQDDDIESSFDRRTTELDDDFVFRFLDEDEAIDNGINLEHKQLTGWKIIGFDDTTYSIDDTIEIEELLGLFGKENTIYIYPVWEGKDITVTYHVYDVKGKTMNLQDYTTTRTIKYGEEFETITYATLKEESSFSTTLTRNFVGWSVNKLSVEGEEFYDAEATYALNEENFIVNDYDTMDLYAVLSYRQTTMTIKYYSADGNTLLSQENSHRLSELATAPTTSQSVPEGKVLVGWSLEMNATESDVLAGQNYYVYPCNMNFYAVYGDANPETTE